MINAKLVDIDDLTAINATDPGTDGIIYRYYNNYSGLYDFFINDNTSTKEFAFVPDTWVLINKLNDEARTSSTTLTADADLRLILQASRTYSIKIVIFFDTVAAADFKYSLSGPASPTLVRIRRQHIEPGGGTFTDAIDTSYTSSTSVTGTGTTGGYVMFDIIVQNGGTGDWFYFNWAQDTSNGSATTVLSGSYLMYNSIPAGAAP